MVVLRCGRSEVRGAAKFSPQLDRQSAHLTAIQQAFLQFTVLLVCYTMTTNSHNIYLRASHEGIVFLAVSELKGRGVTYSCGTANCSGSKSSSYGSTRRPHAWPVIHRLLAFSIQRFADIPARTERSRSAADISVEFDKSGR